jgi:lipopolysaccharide biosynthesis glycosyltransferase
VIILFLTLPSHDRFLRNVQNRIPENCAHTSVVHPTGITSPPQITVSSPRPYTLLNSGTVVLTPSRELAEAVKHYLHTSPLVPTFSFPDQDLLAAYFHGKWKPLPYIYNALKTLRYIHKPLWRDEEVKCLHYILHDKPWNTPPGTAGEYEELNSWWWSRFDMVKTELQRESPQGLKYVLDNMTKAESTSMEKTV